MRANKENRVSERIGLILGAIENPRFLMARQYTPGGTTEDLGAKRGVALILVIFIVALASTLVVNLTYSTHLSARRNSLVQRSVEAEYLLKSAVNVARILIQNDQTDEDSAQDLWGKFIDGQVIPAELLGIDAPNVRISLEIRPEESKISLRQLVSSPNSPPDVKWRDALARLFTELGFDDDTTEVDQTGTFQGKHFQSQELVTLLIDYMDQNDDPYDAIALGQTAFANGVEGPNTKGLFPNSKIARIGELATIPGFTPLRLRKLTPFITTFGTRVNVNTAPKEVLKALNANFDDSIAEGIISFRTGASGPFTDANKSTELPPLMGGGTNYSDIQSMVGVGNVIGDYTYQVLAKVEYDASTFFMRAYLKKQKKGELPDISSIELF